MKHQARSFIEKRLREDGKPTCPRCQSQECGVWKARKRHYQCKGCRKIHSVKYGAVFWISKIP